MGKKSKVKEAEQTLADLSSAHYCSVVVQTSTLNKLYFSCLPYYDKHLLLIIN